MRRFVPLLVILGLVISSVGTAEAAWTVAIPGSPKAQQIRSMDIHSRPNRPLHVYGNAVRARSR